MRNSTIPPLIYFGATLLLSNVNQAQRKSAFFNEHFDYFISDKYLFL